MITTVLFDWDGTLLDTLSAWLRAYHDALKDMGVTTTDEEIVRHVLGYVRGQEYYGITDHERFEFLLKKYARINLDLVQLHDGVREILEYLKGRDFKVGLVTSSPRAFVRQDLFKFELTNYFHTIVALEDTKQHKPNPEPILKALTDLHSSPHEALMVGDSDKDILAAQAADVTALFYYPSVNQLIYLRDQVASWGASNLLSHLDEIKKFLS